MYCSWTYRTFIFSISQNNITVRILNGKKFDWIWSTRNCPNLMLRPHSSPDSRAVIMQTKCDASSILCCTKSFAFDFFHLFLPAMAKPKWNHDGKWWIWKYVTSVTIKKILRKPNAGATAFFGAFPGAGIQRLSREGPEGVVLATGEVPYICSMRATQRALVCAISAFNW